MKVIFSNRAYTSLLAETTEKIKTETGGLFLGTVQDDRWYIVEAIDPGPNSIFEIAYFEYDQKYTQHLINKIANLYDKPLSLIGLWHRHPGSFDQFSSTDDGTNATYAAMRKEGAISALVNIDPIFRITMYHVDNQCVYTKLEYDISDYLIPTELLEYKTPDKFAKIMTSLLCTSRRVFWEGFHNSDRLASFISFIMPYLEEDDRINSKEIEELHDANGKLCLDIKEEMQKNLIDNLIDDLTFLADVIGVETSVLPLNYNTISVYHEFQDGITKLDFIILHKESALKMLLLYNNKIYRYYRSLLAKTFSRAQSERKRTARSIY